jgi:hypothetical protein
MSPGFSSDFLLLLKVEFYEGNKMKNRGLYGQLEGNESRSSQAVMSERFEENERVEGEIVATVRRLLKNILRFRDDRAKIAFEAYIEKLREDGFSEKRIDSILSRAEFGVKI